MRRATRTIDIVIFRFDRAELQHEVEAAVGRGVAVRALIAHTNRGGAKALRKLEAELLAAGVTVSRTADDLLRYHGKMMIVDGTLYVFGFNYTKLDIDKSRSFGISTRDKGIVKEALSLFEADSNRQPYTPGNDRLVVSPETSRMVLSAFIRRAKKQLLIFDEKVTDNVMQRLLQERARAGVEVRVIGKVEKNLDGVQVRKPTRRLHVRAMIRDGSDAFVGSQSLRKVELDGRREVGILVHDTRLARKMAQVFEADWAQLAPKSEKAEKGEKADSESKADAKP